MEEREGNSMGKHCGHSGVWHHYASRYDWTLLGFVIAASIVFLLGNGVVFWNRKRRYFQFQGGAWVIVGGSLGGLMWITSGFVVNGHFRRHGFLGYCKLWTFWLQGVFGFAIWFSAIILRLHKISLLSNRSSRNSMLVPGYVVLSWILVVAFAVVATAKDPFEKCDFGSGRCRLKPAPKVIAWAILISPYFIGIAYLLARLRKEIREPILADEYSYTFEYFVMACIIMVLTWVTFLSNGYRTISGRCFLTFCECCLVFSYFWVKLGRPIYFCIFRPDEMDSLEAQLPTSAGSLETLEAVYGQRSMHVQSSEGAALERFTRATEEVETYKAQIRELEIKKADLLKKLEMKQRRSHVMQIEKNNEH